MQQKNQEKHCFSFYVPLLDKILDDQKNNEFIEIRDEDLLRRVRDVLRMQEEEVCYLFNRMQHILVKIISFGKKEIKFFIQEEGKNSILKPYIMLFLPLLKRSNLEEAIYNATEAGISSIQLIKTAKTTKNLSSHEFERLEKIIIAAAEQSKQFYVPELLLPKPLDELLRDKAESKKIWFDKDGGPYFELIKKIHSEKLAQINILIGPEGDFTEQERKSIISAGFESYALTPTTLRSVSAVSVAIGSLRALVCCFVFIFAIGCYGSSDSKNLIEDIPTKKLNFQLLWQKNKGQIIASSIVPIFFLLYGSYNFYNWYKKWNHIEEREDDKDDNISIDSEAVDQKMEPFDEFFIVTDDFENAVKEKKLEYRRVLLDKKERSSLFDADLESMVTTLIFAQKNKLNEDSFKRIADRDRDGPIKVRKIPLLLFYIFCSSDVKRDQIFYQIACDMLDEAVRVSYEKYEKIDKKEVFLNCILEDLQIVFEFYHWNLENIDIDKLIFVTRLLFCEHKEGNPNRLASIQYDQQNSFWFNISVHVIELFCKNNQTENFHNQQYLDFLFDFVFPYTCVNYKQFIDKTDYCMLNGAFTENENTSRQNFEHAISSILQHQDKQYIHLKIQAIFDEQNKVYNILNTNYKQLELLREKIGNLQSNLLKRILQQRIRTKEKSGNWRTNTAPAVFESITSITSYKDLYFFDYGQIPSIIGRSIKDSLFNERYFEKQKDKELFQEEFVMNANKTLTSLSYSQYQEALGYALFYIIRYANTMNLDAVNCAVGFLLNDYNASLYHCLDKIDLKRWLSTEERSDKNLPGCSLYTLHSIARETEKTKEQVEFLKDMIKQSLARRCDEKKYLLILKDFFPIYNNKMRGVDYIKSQMLLNLEYLEMTINTYNCLEEIKDKAGDEMNILIDGFLLESTVFNSIKDKQEAQQSFYKNIGQNKPSFSYRYQSLKNFILYQYMFVSFGVYPNHSFNFYDFFYKQEFPIPGITIDGFQYCSGAESSIYSIETIYITPEEKIEQIKRENKKEEDKKVIITQNKKHFDFVENILINCFNSSNLTNKEKARLYSMCFFSPFTTSVALKISYILQKKWQEQGDNNYQEDLYFLPRVNALVDWHQNKNRQAFNCITKKIGIEEDKDNEEIISFIDIAKLAKNMCKKDRINVDDIFHQKERTEGQFFNKSRSLNAMTGNLNALQNY